MKPEEIRLAAPCGTNCEACEAYLCKDSPQMLEYVASRGLRREMLPCPGCRPTGGLCPVYQGATCATWECVQQKGVEFCYECDEFPCRKLNPCADRAGVLPHNMKLFNLATIRHQGVEKFRAGFLDVKKRYYKGAMVIGSGPKLEGE